MRKIGRRALLTAPFALLAAISALAPARADVRRPVVVLDTALGPIEIELYLDRAPITAGNFMAYVDKRLWTDASFYRVVRPDNDRTPAITVIQGGLVRDDGPLPNIAHETTAQTGLRHTDGVVSMARGAPGTASCEFFVSLGDNPSLDFGGARNPDGLGFATFGRVIAGMDVVRAINALRDPVTGKTDFMPGQELAHPVAIRSVRRKA
jgi:peptidyl-prolyl cis-trans isomerase A (cyclophilin A)